MNILRKLEERKMSENPSTGNYDKSEYPIENTGCEACRFYRGEKHGCIRKVCYEDERQDSNANGRAKRKRGRGK